MLSLADREEAIRRILRRTRRGENGCLECTYSPSGQGYTQIKYKYKNYTCHILMWEHENGEVPEGLVVNHKCGNRICVNTLHLEVVTKRKNGAYRTVLASNNTTGYRNVWLDKRTGRYYVRINAGGEDHFFSGFTDPKEAHEFAIIKRKELHQVPEFTEWSDA